MLCCLSVQRLCPSQQAWEQRNTVILRIHGVLGGMPDFLPDHLRCMQLQAQSTSPSCTAVLLEATEPDQPFLTQQSRESNVKLFGVRLGFSSHLQWSS
jgi:hypothetical protein